MTVAVRMTGICKRFGAVQANRDVDLTVPAGTVHGIVGENGAGKSTLMSLLYGFHRADAGTIEVEGRTVRIANPREAIALGLGMVHQHFMLVEPFSALDNVLLGAEPHRSLPAARAQVRARLERLMDATGLRVRLDPAVENLPVGERQRLEILKALFRGARILILDEPTAVLTPAETTELFATLRDLRAGGTTLLLITHKLREIIALCDDVTVMRGGRVVLSTPVAATSVDRLAEAMVGRHVQIGRGAGGSADSSGGGIEPDSARCPNGDNWLDGPVERVSGTTAGAPVVPAEVRETLRPHLEARRLTWRDRFGIARLDGVSLTLHPGEIVGVAGITGNGQSELLDVLSGMLAPQEGELALGGQVFTSRSWLDPARARALGLAHVPEDRQRRGLVLPFPAWESAVLGYQSLPRYGRALWMDHRAMQSATTEMMERFDVRPRNPVLASGAFSGGNQQKLVLAREALPGPRVLLVGQPTRGVDIGAIEFIHARLRALRASGSAVLLVSSELDEILALSDRVLVMAGGRIAGELPIAQCDETTLGRLMGEAAHAGTTAG